MLTTPLTQMLGVEKPIMLAGMGGIASKELIAAVSTAGGFGVWGSAVDVKNKGPDELKKCVFVASPRKGKKENGLRKGTRALALTIGRPCKVATARLPMLLDSWVPDSSQVIILVLPHLTRNSFLPPGTCIACSDMPARCFIHSQNRELAEIRDLCQGKPFGIDILVSGSSGGVMKELIKIFADAGATAFISGKGFPRKAIIDEFHARGMLVGSLAGRVKHARDAVEAGKPRRSDQENGARATARPRHLCGRGIYASGLPLLAASMVVYGRGTGVSGSTRRGHDGEQR